MHKPILIKDFELYFPHKTCFSNFNCQINYGSKIGIIGKNGSGKSSLLKMIAQRCEQNVGYIPQIIENYDNLSGAQRFNQCLSDALSARPDILLLDEPTNHLDMRNKKNLLRMLQNYQGTLIIVSHEQELLRSCINTLWHIDNGRINIFNGNYDDYIYESKLKKASILNEIDNLKRQKKEMHKKLMQEQQRAAKSKAKGEKNIENRKWLKMVGNIKGMQAQKSQGKKLKNIDDDKNDLNTKLANLYIPEVIIPKFYLNSADSADNTILSITNGSIGYLEQEAILKSINLSINSKEHVLITGDNGSGKSSLVKAILGYNNIYKSGNWYMPNINDIGYLDQHYSTLTHNKSVFDSILEIVPNWHLNEIRKHLNDFLFRKNEEIATLVSMLSGGEKARLSLALIAAKTPKLLILDEITNNLDLETKEHVLQVLHSYPAAMIIISHDKELLNNLNFNQIISIHEFK